MFLPVLTCCARCSGVYFTLKWQVWNYRCMRKLTKKTRKCEDWYISVAHLRCVRTLSHMTQITGHEKVSTLTLLTPLGLEPWMTLLKAEGQLHLMCFWVNGLNLREDCLKCPKTAGWMWTYIICVILRMMHYMIFTVEWYLFYFENNPNLLSCCAIVF